MLRCEYLIQAWGAEGGAGYDKGGGRGAFVSGRFSFPSGHQGGDSIDSGRFLGSFSGRFLVHFWPY